MDRDIVWEWIDRPGLEHLRLSVSAEAIVAEGIVVAAIGADAIRLRYTLRCDGTWRATTVSLSLEQGADRRTLELCRAGDGWRVDGTSRADLDGCDEIDIQGTPFTNTLPIRRLGLAPGVPRFLRVAYVIVPALTVEAGEQEYTRLDPAEPPRRFRYRNPGNGFIAELAVDVDGIVEDYQGIWRRRRG